MYKIKVKDQEFNINTDTIKGETKLDGTLVAADFVRIRDNLFHIIYQNKSLTAEIIDADYKRKEFTIKVNNNIYKIDASDKYDELLQKMGFDTKGGGKADDIKAPMPGLVLEVKVAEGQAISKGDPVVVLEAMKMENILKASADGTVKRIAISQGNKVEKNDLLIEMS